jgi:hypothetical protein
MKRDYYAKLKNKIFRFISKSVYHNYHYKPTGIYYTSKEYVDSVPGKKPAYVEVYPGLVTHLHIPGDLYALHINPLPKLSVQTDYKVVEIPNGRVYSDNDCSVAIISADNKLIHDMSFTYSETDTVDPETNNIFNRKYFIKPKVYKGTVFSMVFGGVCITNAGHWLSDILPRLHLLKKSGLFDKVDYFLVPSIKLDFQRDTLRMLGIPLEKVIDGEKNPHVAADTILACTTPRGFDDAIPQWTVDFLRDSFLKEEYTSSNLPKRIYISRKDTTIRNVVNEDEVTQLLGKYNFVTYQLSNLNFIEKVRLFANAEMIVSPTGAGLIHMYFSRRDTKLLEIFSNIFVVGPSFDIAGKVGLDYHYIIAKATGKGQGLKQNIHVDIKQLKEAVENMIEEVSMPQSV